MSDQDANGAQGAEPSSRKTALLCPCCGSRLTLAAGNGSSHLIAAKDGAVAIGEIGYDEQTPLEDKYLRLQIELAKELDLPIMIHTPHRDKKRGTTRTMDVLAEHQFDPRRCVIDHNNEETVREVLDRNFYAGFSIYPQTKMGNERMTEIVRHYGPERIIV